MNTAKYITTLPGWQSDARVYELDPPIDDAPAGQWHYVIVSAVNAFDSGPETYIFPAKKVGDTFKPVDMMELEGSLRGALDHKLALANAGYPVVIL